MAIKKSELYSSLWQMCDELRGGMDASQYKDYVLVLLFVKYISDKYAGKKGALIEIPSGASFADMVKLVGDKEIGDKINKIVAKIFKANNLSGIAVADFNDEDKLGKGKEMVDRLSSLVKIFDNPDLDFRGNRAEDDDLLGDAYEYLMRHFATESGKSKGQFYTPAEVSRVMAQVLGITKATKNSQTIYDPTCGSGSLLLKAHDEAKHATGYDLALYGQEKDNATTALAKMNMILHDCPAAVHDIINGNTLANPEHKNEKREGELKTFDFIVSNPPFSDKKWQNGLVPTEDLYNRFEFGVPPAKNGDYAYLLHLLSSLNSTGKGVIVMPHGVLFRGNVEAQIRENLIKHGYIKGIIGLPANLFYGTSIPACLVVVDKENASARKGIFMIDASKGFVKDGNKNRLREQDVQRIVDVFNDHEDSDSRFARMVLLKEIEKHEYNLNIPRYIDSTEPEDTQDIQAHLLGGIPNKDIDELSEYWAVYPNLRKALFENGDRPGYSKLRIGQDKIRQTIFEHPEFVTYSKKLDGIFDKWKAQHTSLLKAPKIGTKPRQVIEPLAESILKTYAGLKLINRYDIYQHLLAYWHATMKDDVYMIVEGGWKAEVKEIVKEKGKQSKKVEGTIKIEKREFICELVSKELVIQRYFKTEWDNIQKLQALANMKSGEREQLEEQYSGEEGVLEDLKNEKGKVTKASVQERIKEIKKSKSHEFEDELEVLIEYQRISDEEALLNKSQSDKSDELAVRVLKKLRELTTSDVQELVVDRKWLQDIYDQILGEIERISQRLAERVVGLSERYRSPLPRLLADVEKASHKVDRHLQEMGFSW